MFDRVPAAFIPFVFCFETKASTFVLTSSLMSSVNVDYGCHVSVYFILLGAFSFIISRSVLTPM